MNKTFCKRRTLYSLYRMFLCFISITLFFVATASANSSWIWLTNVKPSMVFPIAILVTIIIEVFTIKHFGKVKSSWLRVVGIVLSANLVSFLVPYFIRFFTGYLPLMGFSLESLQLTFNGGPFYIVLLGYLLLTIVFEIPIVYWGLRKNILSERSSKIRLVITIVVANVITTVLVAISERIFSHGYYI